MRAPTRLVILEPLSAIMVALASTACGAYGSAGTMLVTHTNGMAAPGARLSVSPCFERELESGSLSVCLAESAAVGADILMKQLVITATSGVEVASMSRTPSRWGWRASAGGGVLWLGRADAYAAQLGGGSSLTYFLAGNSSRSGNLGASLSVDLHLAGTFANRDHPSGMLMGIGVSVAADVAMFLRGLIEHKQ